MDPALIREHNAFKRNAARIPVVERRPVPAQQPAPAPPPARRGRAPANFDYKTASSSSQQTKFLTLNKIVKYMKSRHLEGDTHALSMEDILEELNVHDLPISTKIWLSQEALPQNPKIQTFAGAGPSAGLAALEDGPKFTFKPKYNLKSRKDLLELLKSNYRDSLAGVYLDDIRESLANSDTAVNYWLDKDRIVQISRPQDKRVVLFYNDSKASLPSPVSEELVKLWRQVTVDSMDETKIEEHLAKHGIDAMQGTRKSFIPAQKQRKARRRVNRPVRLRDNEHLADMLQDYSEKFRKDK